ncbi:uncharacterized protein BXZ73DRAFT_96534 [Epithele typhae]|uniref:uncharacterized protein n=1 Tax=Epithele typhae TaxID=378194 RepID=UPI002008102A|nr:uncharacterized protein BXZ73DRAFT_96534 [Epithele typhae]KAH9944021.1 hypothetical protein BXZ73DRAFT_96534 [Epithele typhae]
MWATFQNRGEGSLSTDLPEEFRRDVDDVFDVFSRLPEDWVVKCKLRRGVRRVVSAEFLSFLDTVQADETHLFSHHVDHQRDPQLLSDLQVVFAAHLRAKAMVLLVGRFRKPTMRIKFRPDGILFVPSVQLSPLCRTEKSPYNYLAQHRRADESGSVGGRTSFKSQATLCKQLPSQPCFEIASTIWEDKKPAQGSLDAAKRQNSMSTTAALRQLHYLRVNSPVFGLVFAEGLVRMHVDWWREDDGKFRIVSAPYTGPGPKRGPESRPPYEWRLDHPADIVKLFLVMRNLDAWTVGAFCNRVTQGIKDLHTHVKQSKKVPTAWRRRSEAGVTTRRQSCASSVVTEAGESISILSRPRRPAKKRSAK